MRRERAEWSYVVLSILMCAYGGSLFFYNLQGGGSFPTGFLILFIIGIIFILAYIFYRIYRINNNRFVKKNMSSKPIKIEKEEIKEDKVIEVKEEPKEVKEDVIEEKPQIEKVAKRDYEYVRESTPSFYRRPVRTIYVNRMGYGPVLRLDGNRIYDMRNGTYYIIEDDYVKQEGYGPVYEISSNRIREAYGSYLYELSGSNINKVYGGYFASVSGYTIVTHDSSQRYEFDDSLSSKQILAVAALLFGRY